MTPAKIIFTNHFGYKCTVHGSFVKVNGHTTIHSFEGNYSFNIPNEKIISIKQINLKT